MELELKLSPVNIRISITEPRKTKNNRSHRMKSNDQEVNNLETVRRREQKISSDGMSN